MPKQESDSIKQTASEPFVSDQQIKQVKKLLAVLKESALEEVRIKVGDISLSIRRTPAAVPVAASLPAPQVEAASMTQPTATNLTHQTHIKSPMVGTFYAAVNPESKPFVQVGDKISVGQTICIIEAMKLFNNIEAEEAGTIVEILVENATAVEYEQPLFVIDTSK